MACASEIQVRRSKICRRSQRKALAAPGRCGHRQKLHSVMPACIALSRVLHSLSVLQRSQPASAARCRSRCMPCHFAVCSRRGDLIRALHTACAGCQHLLAPGATGTAVVFAQAISFLEGCTSLISKVSDAVAAIPQLLPGTASAEPTPWGPHLRTGGNIHECGQCAAQGSSPPCWSPPAHHGTHTADSG